MLPTKTFFKIQFSMILLVCLSGFFSSAVLAGPQAITNRRDLNAALKTAKSKEDHQRIAAYYQEQAQRLQKKAKEEQELADYFLAHPSMYGKVYPTPYQNHKWRADNYYQAANTASEKAGKQLKLAGEGRAARPQ
jgi:hypothetical protein